MAQSGKLSITTREVGKVLLVILEGDVLLGRESVLMRDQLRGELDGGRKFVLLDLAKVNFMDSTGIGLLVEIKAHTMHSGGDIRLCNCPDLVSKLLHRLALNKIIVVYQDQASAMADWH
jgi:anti-sigma B factor antagonist